MKLLFVSPIVSRRYARDWEEVNRGLAATVASLSQQINPDWKMMVIGGDEPCLPGHLKRHVIFVKADLEIDEPASKGRREIDKQRKQYCGYVELHRYAPEYVMPLDYDDLVSVRLVQYVAEHSSVDAFVLKRGYVYQDGSDHCQYSHRLYRRTGSNLVVRYRRDLFPTEPSDFHPPPAGYLDWPFIASHIKRPQKLFVSLGLSYKTVPFPAVVWRRNANSISNAFQTPGWESGWGAAIRGHARTGRLLDLAKRLAFSRKLDAALCREFGCKEGSNLGMNSCELRPQAEMAGERG
jgi:hypothetical protein